MCTLFSIERSGYYSWLNPRPSKRHKSNEELDKKIFSIFNAPKSRYGAKRITDELQDAGERCSKNRVAKRMHPLGLHAKAKKKYKVTTDSKHNVPRAANLLNRDFSTTGPHQKGVGAISSMSTEEGWMY